MGSMHSIAFKDPVFQAEWALAEKAMGGQLLNHCGGCHTPIGIATGTVKFDPSLGKHGGFTAPKVAAEGVSCDVCHTAVRTTHAQSATGDPGNASLALNPGETKYGPLLNSVSGYHETQYSELHTKAEFCGSCHNIFHPFNQFPIEHTYDEWKVSPYAQAGIPEYWIVNLVDRQVIVHREPQEGRYSSVTVLAALQVSPAASWAAQTLVLQ